MANAIEMAIGAALNKVIDGLQDRLPELIANLPVEVRDTVGQIGKSVAAFQSQLDRIEANQKLIMARLEIAEQPETKGLTDGQLTRQ